jgi:recombinational DNA repair protein RecR
MNATPEGDNTVDYLMHILKPFVAHDGNQPNSQSNSGTSAQHTQNIKISVLGRGISTGTELEYSDSDTLRNALENRH